MNYIHSENQTLAGLYQFFDQLAEQDADSDVLFASSYIRGFIGLSAGELGNEEQVLSQQLAAYVSTALQQSRAELSPQDREIVNQYWQQILPRFSA